MVVWSRFDLRPCKVLFVVIIIGFSNDGMLLSEVFTADDNNSYCNCFLVGPRKSVMRMLTRSLNSSTCW